MKLLAIETSCDETAVAVVVGEAVGSHNGARFTVLGNALLSQIDIHKEYGGVYPMIAKREHAKNLVPLLAAALEQAGAAGGSVEAVPHEVADHFTTLLAREEGLAAALLSLLDQRSRPQLDAIAVTAGPGLEPALWVGVNFAKALSLAWNIPIVSVNHMEGHICTALASTDEHDSAHITIPDTEFPLLSLLISGGHTELVLTKNWGEYELLGRTRDDAVGEAFAHVGASLPRRPRGVSAC
jgi:N6-L-threonylcarbamoyladenine synthase